MTILTTLQRKGFRFQIDGEQLKVNAPDNLLTDHAIEQLRKHKSEIMVECRLRNFTRLAQHFGADHGLMLEESEILGELDSQGIEELRTASTEVRQSWAESIATRLVQARGIVPKGWDKIANCAHCGPVYSFHDLDTLSCGWCDMRLAGKWFPQPELA